MGGIMEMEKERRGERICTGSEGGVVVGVLPIPGGAALVVVLEDPHQALHVALDERREGRRR
jgi:hypothetical protein